MANDDLAERKKGWRFAGIAAVVFAIVSAAMFGDLLMAGQRLVISEPGNDVTTFNLPMREYGFDAVRSGRLPLWNPHVYGGTPFAANVQAALFYPLNWIHLIMPGVMAVNVGVAMHFFLAGWLAAMWGYRRTGSELAGVLAGMVFACSGGYFLHVYPGHLTMLHAGAWSPGMFLCIDGIMGNAGKKRLRWGIGLALITGMIILAGHPQTAYYIAVAAGVYAIAHVDLWWRKRMAWGVIAVAGVVGIGLSAVQLLPAWELSKESTRSGGLSASVLREFALPVENLLTVVLPHLFGGPGERYVGRWFLWEGSIFIGGIAAMLGVYGLVMVPRTRRLVGVAIVLVMLAGVEGTVQEWARLALPGYATFRAAGRFGMLVDLLLAIVAAEGLAEMMSRGKPTKEVVGGAAMAGVALAAGAGWLAMSPDAWSEALSTIAATGQSMLPPGSFQETGFLEGTHATACWQLATAGAILIVTAAVMGLWRWRINWMKWCAGGLVVLAGAEVFGVARSERAAGSPEMPFPQTWKNAVKEADAISPSGSGRVATIANAWANMGMVLRYYDAMGYDPTALGRYAKYLAVSQGEDWSKVEFVPPIRKASAMLDALRVRAVLYISGHGAEAERVDSAFPRFVWIHHCEVCRDLDEVLGKLAQGMDLRRTVLLEKKPLIEPAEGGADGAVRIIRETPESVEIEATTPAAAILLMTDVYAKGWQVRGEGELMPADGTLRGIPLSAGTHQLTVFYIAPGLAAGTWITAISAAVMLGAAWMSRQRGEQTQ
ncbi:MAG TPA: hypothetical protein VFE58_13760 [Tepidisphaeraceae bacterium]|jgi:hypothetical protein|nr:hypothetical protein [Tepidisphaeraceae bacterium]